MLRKRKLKLLLSVLIPLVGVIALYLMYAAYLQSKSLFLQPVKGLDHDFSSYTLYQYGFFKQDFIDSQSIFYQDNFKPNKIFEEKGLHSAFIHGNLTDYSVHYLPLYNHILSSTKDMKAYLMSMLTKFDSGSSQFVSVVASVREYFRILEHEMEYLSNHAGIFTKQAKVMAGLQSYVQNRINAFQNPKDCKSFPKLVCNLDNPHGFSAGIHDVLWCFVAALQAGKTLILNSTYWHFAPKRSWKKTFKPLTGESCYDVSQANDLKFPGYDSSTRERKEILELPKEIASLLLQNHGNPYAWWYGQIISYILRLQESVENQVNKLKYDLRYSHPIVGIHIRKTDKIREATYHKVEEYMIHVEEFYRKLALKQKIVEKKVFVATDEPSVFTELLYKFPDYVFIYEHKSASEANNLKLRGLASSLLGVIKDIYLLAQSDHIICTLSSGMCRVAFELMQTYHADASNKVTSLDVEYFYAYVPFPPKVALYTNSAVHRSEHNFKTQDLVSHLEDYQVLQESKLKKFWDGYVVGRLLKNHEVGICPNFKMAPTFRFKVYKAFHNSSQQYE